MKKFRTTFIVLIVTVGVTGCGCKSVSAIYNGRYASKPNTVEGLEQDPRGNSESEPESPAEGSYTPPPLEGPEAN